MSLGFYFAPAAMSAESYNECMTRLNKAGARHPKGRQYHSAFGAPDKVMVFDVWDSQESFEAFGKTLMPILGALGIDPGQPNVMPMHGMVVPPAPAAKKAAPKKVAKPVAKKAAKKVVKKAAPKAAKKPARKAASKSKPKRRR